ncbi:MAG: hypothetical protein AB7O57_02315 [Hyphomicrobiaceae bacterium]
MKALPLTATLLAAAVLLGARPLAAADLDYGYVPPPDRYASAYEDPRYRDLYAPEPSRGYRYEPRPYVAVPPPPAPVPPGYVYRQHDRFAEWGPGENWRYAEGCLPRHAIKRRLVDEGWRDFHDLDVAHNIARVKARRPNGDLFELKVDRCNGEVVRADLLDRYGPGPYAWRGDQRRYERPYY